MGQAYKHIDAVERDFIHRGLIEGRTERVNDNETPGLII